jgi:CRP-like cAMP-binding protein
MIFDLCEIVQIKKGQTLFKQDQPVTDIFFVMHGRISLRCFSENTVDDFQDSGHLGQTLGEEILFYLEKTYRETAMCSSASCCILQIRAEYIFELGDESFMNRGLGAEAMKNDMDLMFERMSHIYNFKERWRISIGAK